MAPHTRAGGTIVPLTFDLRTLFNLKGYPPIVVQQQHGEGDRLRLEFKHEDNRQKLTMARVFQGMRSEGAIYEYDPTRHAYTVTLADVLITVDLDERGRNHRMSFSRDGQPISYITYEHAGNTITQRNYHHRQEGTPFLSGMKVQTLDAQGRVKRSWNAADNRTDEYAYDNDGFVSLHTSMKPGGDTTRTQYQYVLGYEGNWVSRRTLTWDKRSRSYEQTAWTMRYFDFDVLGLFNNPFSNQL